MTIKTAAVSVGTTATRLDVSADSDSARPGQNVSLYNSGAATVFLGGSDVTTSNGVPLAAGAYAELELQSGSDLYGRVASGTVEVRVMQVGV